MANAHSAGSLFAENIKSAEACIQLHDGIEKLGSPLDIKWLLRAAVVFAVSALDAYFHDKVKYRAGHFDLHDMPPPLADFQIPVSEIATWESAARKGNVLRNWVTEYFATKPLQRKDDIAKALRMVGIENLWATLEPNSPNREAWLDQLGAYVRRRNQIAHEGDRESSRKSGKKLRAIDRAYADGCMAFVKDMVARIEAAF